ncbi:PIN domain-containing protein [Ketobacter alkanivorans]|uniref:PIN domain-containing protein n=1 Tax=Ketobacter alkanivorans TaxID=1917421 RepID=A0A2K9LQZ3_9GAMM|nr:PIN domain-containing protein [Ketobacter alkanivorans]AUM14713.1 hypothetical protein Kalk_20775 [Ketobacter alkanivorans]
MNKSIIIDVCTILDYMLPHRKEHEKAKSAFSILLSKSIKVSMPAHGFCEFKSAIICEYKNKQGVLVRTDIDLPDIAILAIDESFVVNEFIPSLNSHGIIDLKSADMIYVVKAISTGSIILTQDKKMLSKANTLVDGLAVNYDSFIQLYA